MIGDVDQTLCNLLAAEMPKLPGCPITDKSQIAFSPPAVAESAAFQKPHLNLYLHDVRENLSMRDEGFRLTRKPGESTVGIRRAPVSLDLSYLVTAYAGEDPSAEHRLLSDTLAVLLRYQAAPPESLAGVLAGQTVLMAVAQPDRLANPPALWQALGGHMRAALNLTVTASFNPYETKWTKVVREAIIGTGVGTPPHGPNRPLDMASIRVSVAGVVIDQAEDKPLPGVTVTVDGRDESVITDDEGFLSLLNLPAGRQTLRLRKTGYQPQEFSTDVPPAGRPELLEPAVIALHRLSDTERAAEVAALAADFRSRPPLGEAGRVFHVSLSGTLRREDGRPAAYIPVRAGGKCTTTDGEGVYCFFDLPAGPHTVIAEMPGVGDVEVLALSEKDDSGAALAERNKPKKSPKNSVDKTE